MTTTPLTPQQAVLDLLRTRVRAPIEKRADEILDSLRADPTGLAAFQRARADLDALITRLEHRQLQDLARLLDTHGVELRAGIADLDETLSKGETLQQAARVFWRIVGIAARIVALA